MLSFYYGGQWFTRQVDLIGVDAATQSRVSDFSKSLQHPENRREMSFELRDGGYDLQDHQAGPQAAERPQMRTAGWEHRRRVAAARALGPAPSEREPSPANPEGESGERTIPFDPFAARKRAQEADFDMSSQQHTGLVVGIALANFRDQGTERFVLLPGDDVRLTFATAGSRPTAMHQYYTVVDFYECKMSEYDSKFVFVPIEALQRDRQMFDPATGTGMFNTIQVKLKPGAKNIVLTASDGFTAEVTLDALSKCADCMMAFGDGGKIHAAMPGMESNTWVKDVVKIEVK